MPDDSVFNASEDDTIFGSGTTSSCTSSTPKSAACLVKNYLNSVNAAENEFSDPDGWYYGVTVQDAGKNGSNIATLNTQFTNAGFNHMIYVTKHAKCDGEVMKGSSNSRDYAVMYKLEGNGTYCADNGS